MHSCTQRGARNVQRAALDMESQNSEPPFVTVTELAGVGGRRALIGAIGKLITVAEQSFANFRAALKLNTAPYFKTLLMLYTRTSTVY